MRWMVALGLILIAMLVSGCGVELDPAERYGLASEQGAREAEVRAQSQVSDVIETIGANRLHGLGLSGRGVTIFLIAPFKNYRAGMVIPVGVYLQQIIKEIVPGAEIRTCDSGGDFFSVEPVQLSDCLLEALAEQPEVVAVGAVGWSKATTTCEDLSGGEISRSNLTVFAGAGDSNHDGLVYPACVPGVIPMVATYAAEQTGNLPFLSTCWRESVHKDEPTCFTNYLSEKSLLAAPGAVIEIGFFGVHVPYCCSTAISAVIAAAAMALLKEGHPEADHAEILKALRETGVPVLDARGRTVGVRISAYRAHLWLEEHAPKREPPLEPASKTVKDFDSNGDCLISTDELLEAEEAWMRGEIDMALFIKVMDAWMMQSDVCSG